MVDDAFLPVQPLSNLNDKKEPLLICKVNETMFDMLEGLLMICSVVLPPVFIDVTETVSDEACARGLAKLDSKIPTVNAKKILDFNNTFLYLSKIYL